MVDIAVRQTEAPVLLSVCENLAAFFGKKYFRLSRKNGANYIQTLQYCQEINNSEEAHFVLSVRCIFWALSDVILDYVCHVSCV